MAGKVQEDAWRKNYMIIRVQEGKQNKSNGAANLYHSQAAANRSEHSLGLTVSSFLGGSWHRSKKRRRAEGRGKSEKRSGVGLEEGGPRKALWAKGPPCQQGAVT